MIIDTIDQANRYGAIPGLSRILAEISRMDANTQPGTRIDLGSEVGAVTVAEFTSKTAEEHKRFEAHRRFADVHVVLSGEEVIDLSALDSLNAVTDFDSESDIGFHEGDTTVSVKLRPGWFVVCFPQDAHRPGLALGEPARVLKAVGKLRVG